MSLWTTPASRTDPLEEASIDDAVSDEDLRRAVDLAKERAAAFGGRRYRATMRPKLTDIVTAIRRALWRIPIHPPERVQWERVEGGYRIVIAFREDEVEPPQEPTPFTGRLPSVGRDGLR
jgi:hypothetical protein